ncbi:MORN repeat-containing protein 4 [Hondaea fermentalgiana]|uniref:MORN repeat-containing protein 4 n=1 Tax=Hondaea fermentalgiana TaxID=2315210 RepID=A0A2R5GHE1_9STRA|nr:MORN repeat-containing protein 4 [Hondaea fermentalgiana]|eukprot:GBG29148.1 MORN repeat-containing protein 4 [Hondaea fermentalgiana]
MTKKAKAAAEAELEAVAPRRGRGRFELPMAHGTAVYDGEWTETQVERPVPTEDDDAADSGEPVMETITVMIQDGQGKLDMPEMSESFEGEWRQGSMWNGVYSFADGSTYEGEFQGTDNFHGRGALTLVNGDRFEGMWSEGKMHGQGTLTAASCKQPSEWTGIFAKGSFKSGTGSALELPTDPKQLPPTVRFLLSE